LTGRVCVCGAALTIQRSTRRYCSGRCRQQALRDRRNGKALSVTCALPAILRGGRLRERGDDCYQTPPEAVLALLKAEQIPAVVWEPACGPGAIARVLRAAGHVVHATDLVDYRSPDQAASGIDFLLEQRAPPGVQCIVTNPPYKLAREFAEHALRLCPRV
jgi:hypothetical protein